MIYDQVFMGMYVFQGSPDVYPLIKSALRAAGCCKSVNSTRNKRLNLDMEATVPFSITSGNTVNLKVGDDVVHRGQKQTFLFKEGDEMNLLSLGTLNYWIFGMDMQTGGEEHANLSIPSRNSRIHAYGSGDIQLQGQAQNHQLLALCHKLSLLNSLEPLVDMEPTSNYRMSINTKILAGLEDRKMCLMLTYLGNSSNVILASNGYPVYMQFVRIHDTSVLMWTNSGQLLKKFAGDVVSEHIPVWCFFGEQVQLGRSMCVLNFVYLKTKWREWCDKYRLNGRALFTIQALTKYLQDTQISLVRKDEEHTLNPERSAE